MSDDEDDTTPVKFEFSPESKLDEDHLFYLQFTNNFISNVTRPRDFDHCTRWLERLAGEPMYGIEAKRNRNMYLAMLLIAMQDNRVVGPFASFPPAGPLPKANEAFGLTEKHDDNEASLMLHEKDRELNMEDYRFVSEDGRTYSASCTLPEGRGVMGYVGISTGGGEGLWINKEGENVCLQDFCPERIETVTTNTSLKKQAELYEKYDFRNPKTDPENPFAYLTHLTQSNSAHKLVTTGSYKFSKTHITLLRENYPNELVHRLECLMVEHKHNIEKIQRQRHNKVVTQLYESFRSEVEAGLLAYKEARQEWLEVFTVVDEVRRMLAEMNASQTTQVRQNNNQMNMLHSTLVDARKRQQMCMESSKTLEAHKEELHRGIHDMTIQHKHDLQRMCTTVEALCAEIRRLRTENRRKQQVIDGLCKDIDGDKF